jgi:hypothetical protein
LQTDQDENQAIEDEGEQTPDGVGLEADAGREKTRTAPAEVKAGSYDGENSGRVEGFGGEVGGVRNEKADGDFDRAVVNLVFEPFDEAGDDQADGDAGSHEIGEASDRGQNCGILAVDDHGGGEFESEEAGGIVEEAFAFENVHDAFGKADAFRDGGGGDSVGSGNDGTEHEASAPVYAGENPGDRGGDSKDGEGHEANGERGDAGEVVAEVAPGGDPRGGVKKWREDYEENQVGVERNSGDAGDKTNEESCNDEDYGVRSPEALGEGGENDYEEE